MITKFAAAVPAYKARTFNHHFQYNRRSIQQLYDIDRLKIAQLQYQLEYSSSKENLFQSFFEKNRKYKKTRAAENMPEDVIKMYRPIRLCK